MGRKNAKEPPDHQAHEPAPAEPAREFQPGAGAPSPEEAKEAGAPPFEAPYGVPIEEADYKKLKERATKSRKPPSPHAQEDEAAP